MLRCSTDRPPHLIQILCISLLISVGLWFRITNLDEKVFWVDEVATVLRVAGYTKQEVITSVTASQWLSPSELQTYQHLSADRPFLRSMQAFTQSPEHAPLYFILARLWAQQFGTSVAAIRSLSVLLSGLALPCVYWLTWELFGRSCGIAVAIVAISPFFVAYAQEARPYSLWTVALLCSGGALLRAIRVNDRASWGVYACSLTGGFYTSLLSLLVALGQGIYVARSARSRLTPYALALSAAGIAFLPWLWVVVQHRAALDSNTAWMRTAMHPLAMVAIWLYSVVILFFDVPVSIAPSMGTAAKLLAAIAILVLVACAGYRLCTRTSARIWLFIFASSLTVPVGLILLDSVFNGQASATARYLIPLQLGVVLAIGWLLHDRLATKHPLWIGIAALLTVSSLVSCWLHLHTAPDYQKDRDRANPAIAAIVNQAAAPVLLAEPSQTLDVLSLSYYLNTQVKIRIAESSQLVIAIDRCTAAFLFNPTELLRNSIQQTKHFKVEEVYQPRRLMSGDSYLSLWQIHPSGQCDTSS